MNGIARRLAGLGLLALFALFGACAAPGPPAPSSRRIQVAVSVPPQGYLVERIGGPRVAVEVMIPPGASHSTYSPSPRQMIALSDARLYVEVGHPAFLFETAHILPFLASRPGIRVVDMSRGMDLILNGEGAGEGERRAEPKGFFGREEDHDHAGGDPHVWVAPSSVEAAAVEIARSLSELDPRHRAEYRANLAGLLADVDALDREIRSLLRGESRRAFLVYHPAWGYFAREYGLTQIAIESGGREPSAARLIALVEQARRAGVRAVFVQRGFATKSAEVVAAEIGARVVVVDPMGRDWLAEMRRAAHAFRGAVRDV